ncbi:MAG: hypothetical protein GY846_20795, partial [Deltaproteobacteria bacterium]|nr:hypothetical protein [Deltaproteobacteria bacterium]
AGEVFPRERLFGTLDTLRLAPVIWIEGPAGCGKTYLTSSYLEARALPCLWYQVDPGDADPATFFYYLGLAAKRTAPRKRKPMPLFTPEYVPGINTFSLRFFEELFNRLPSPCAVVFDNFQEVQANSPFHEVIKNGLSTAPEGINVFCVSREAPPPALTRMLTTDRMNILKWDDLRLTRDELAGIVQLKNRTLSKNTISRLQDITDGWIAGLVLILQSAVTREMDEKLIGKMLPEEIADYFGGEIFFQNTPEEQDFLLKT